MNAFPPDLCTNSAYISSDSGSPNREKNYNRIDTKYNYNGQ